MRPKIAARSTARQIRLTYIRATAEYISAHRTGMAALRGIAPHRRDRRASGGERPVAEGPALALLESLLARGRREGELRAF